MTTRWTIPVGKWLPICLLCCFITAAMLFQSCKKNNTAFPPLYPVSSSPPPPPPTPPPSTINLHLDPFDTLSQARYQIVPGAAGNKILFAGGRYSQNCFVPGGDYGDSMASVCISESTRVDIYDTSTHSWSTHELGRYYAATSSVTAGNKVFFAGGTDTSNRAWSDKVDVYDASTNSWSTIQLSEPRTALAVASLGNKVFFAGGVKALGFQNVVVSDKVDIYDISSNSWSTATLSEARTGIAATTVGDKVIFAGGDYFGWWPVSSRTDIYNATTNTWSTASLSEARSSLAAITLNNRAFFAGGITGFTTPSSHKVDIFDNSTGAWSVEQVNIWGLYLKAVSLNNKFIILYGRYGNMYNASTNSWTDVVLDQNYPGWSGIIAVGNYIYFAGGSPTYFSQTNQVWELEF